MGDQAAMASRVFHVPMPLVRASLSAQDMADLLQLAHDNAPDPSIFADAPPFFARARISNNSLDSYFTKMHTSSLKNYAADAEAGVSVLTNHNHLQLGFGRSLTGKFTGSGGNGVARVESDFYTIPGLQLGDLSSDEIIRGIRSGIAKDTSIGFYGGRYECGLCKQDYFSYECSHIAGVEYQFEDIRTAAFAWVIDAHLAEYSMVFDGSTPGAEVIAVKSQQEADAGRMTPETARMLEARFGVRVRGAEHQWGGVTLASMPVVPGLTERNRRFLEEETERTQPAADGPAAEEEGTMPPEANGNGNGTPELTDEQREQMRVGAQVMDLYARRTLVQDGETVTDATVRLADEVTRLRPLADMGTRYKADLITEALAEGVRAKGDVFATETYRGVLDTADIDTIKRFRDDWKVDGDDRFKGGRVTVEGDETEQQPVHAGRRGVPDAAYGG